LQKGRKAVARSTIALLLLALTIPLVMKETRATPDVTLSAVNPGPGSWANMWTAEKPNSSDIGSTNFTFHSTQTSVGNTFFVNITVSNVQLAKGWGVGVIFDNTTIAFNSGRRPPDNAFAPVENMGWPIIAPGLFVDSVDNTHQIVEWGFAYIPTGSSTWCFNGTGTLCQFSFDIVGSVNASHPKWSTLLTFDPDWTSLYEQPSGSIPYDPVSGTVTYLYPVAPRATALTISPGSVVDPSLTPSHSFTVNLTVVNATDLYSWQAVLYFSNQILNATDMHEGSFLPTIGTTVFQSTTNLAYNATHGRVTLTENLTGAASGASGDGQLATITFHVLDNGSTPITISNDTLYDSTKTQIAHTTTSGYFNNVPAAVTVDVAVTKVETYKTAAYAGGTNYVGWLVPINVTVGNLGSTSETFDVKVYYDANLIDTKTVTALAAGSQMTLAFVWNTTTVPPSRSHNYTISAQIPALPQETNVTNNQLTDGTVKVKLMGDVDGSGTVDMMDLIIILRAFGARPGHPRWDPNSDLEQNNRIDLTDIMRVLLNLGKSY
jgi:hypothetical protein